MRKNLRVIQINGFRGILLAVGIVSCLVAGFIVFPGLVAKELWNYAAEYFTLLPTISMLSGILLWGVCIAAYFAFKKRQFVVSFHAQDEMSNEEIENIMSKVRAQSAMITPEMLKHIEQNIEKEQTEKAEKDLSKKD